MFIYVAILFTAFGVFLWSRVPPKEAAVIKRFQQRRDAYERLNGMLGADLEIRCVRSDGVTTKSHAQIPPERAKPYIALLKETGAKLVLQSGERSNRVIEVSTWTWGWAGLSRDVGISWNEQPPTNQVQALFGRRPRGSMPGQDVFYKHIDQNWYVWANF
jgi:hypothetical protein